MTPGDLVSISSSHLVTKWEEDAITECIITGSYMIVIATETIGHPMYATCLLRDKLVYAWRRALISLIDKREDF